MKKYSGRCICGAVTWRAAGSVTRNLVCHCADCQALSGPAFRTIGMVAADTFRIVKGQPREYVKVGDSGNPRVQAFCGTCGSGLYATDTGDSPAAYNIRLGTTRQRHELAPRFECWRHSALPWLPENRQTEKFDGNPG